MRTILKAFAWTVTVLIILAAGAFTWLTLRSPKSQPPSVERVEATAARLARGEYLVHHVSDCLGCHSEFTNGYSVPPKVGTEGKGGFRFDEIPGILTAKNITPDPETGIGAWTDGEIIRAMREGVSRDGHALFPVMPYPSFKEMGDEDAKSIVAYLRTLKPIRNQVAVTKLGMPLNFIVKFIPEPLTKPVTGPTPSDHIAYGRYLTRIGNCHECHTERDKKGPDGLPVDFAGGNVMTGPWGTVVTANLTPDPETYIGRATKEEFIARFKSFQNVDPDEPVKGRNTVMPWIAFSGMSPDDLGAIYDYLRTVKPVKHKVDTFPPISGSPQKG